MQSPKGFKQFRKQTRLEAAASQIEQIQSVIATQRKLIERLNELNRAIVMQLAGMGLKVVSDKKGGIKIEPAKEGQ